MARFRIGTAPVTWGVDADPTWGPQLPPARVLAEMQQAGYEGTELGPPGYLPEDQAELTGILDPHHLQLISAYCAIDLHSVDVVPAEVDQVRRAAACWPHSGLVRSSLGRWAAPTAPPSPAAFGVRLATMS